MFNDNSLGANLYSWNFGDNSSGSNTQNPTHTFADTGSFTVSLIGVSQFGCSDTIIHYYDVLVPYMDLIMENVSYTQADNLLNLTAHITNAGNISAATYILEATVEGGNTIQETSPSRLQLWADRCKRYTGQLDGA